MELYIAKYEERIYYYTVNEFGHVYDLYPQEMLEQTAEGNFYMGIVRDKKNAFATAFVEIGEENVGFLPYSETVGNISSGEHILVQAVRNSKDQKGAKLTMKYSFEGVYCVLLWGEKGLFYSQKMKPNTRRQVADFLGEKRLNHGFIIRSGVEDVEKLWQEMMRLEEKAKSLVEKAAFRKAPSLVLTRDRFDILKNFKQVADIYTNDRELYDELVLYLKTHQIPISAHYREENYYIRHDIKKALAEGTGRRVWLNSGGYLIIEKSEAFHSIDVNTGKTKGGKTQEKTNFKTNLEAAKEVARQIRLRNLSGIILVDFIDLKEEENQKELTRSLKELTKYDPVPTIVHGLTKLGIMEITRKKKFETLEEWGRKAGINLV